MMRILGYFFTVFIAVLLGAGCSSPFATPGKTVLAPTPISLIHGKHGEYHFEKDELGKSVPVFICSSRNLAPDADRVDPFGNKRSDELVPYLAIAQVSIGQNTTPEIVLAETINEVKRKKTKVKMGSVTMYDSPKLTPFSSTEEKKREFGKNIWLKKLAAEMQKSDRKELTIFVHGYNTSLVENTELLGEMHHYAGRQGAVINYEWPSAGKLLGYFKDKGNAEHSTRLFRSFVSRVGLMTGAESVRIIAHSAGNPIVVNALAKYKISQVVLAAPDMDSMRFMNAVFDRFFEMASNVTVYAYPKDKALAVSGKLFGTNRVGSALEKMTDWEKETLKQAANLQMVDVTLPQKQYGSLLGHGYFHRDPWVSSDILLGASISDAADRGLQKSKEGVFWEFSQDYPDQLKALHLLG